MAYVITTISGVTYLKDIGYRNAITHPASLDLTSLGFTDQELDGSNDLQTALTGGFLSATYNGNPVTPGVLISPPGLHADSHTNGTDDIQLASASQKGILSSTDWTTFNNKGSGSVTSVSVVSTNGFDATVSSPNTTPAITMKTTVTGVLRGNSGTGVVDAAQAGIDFVAPNATIPAGLGTKITYDAKGLVTTSAFALLASSDFANQGTTSTVLHGNASGNPSFSAVSLTSDVANILPVLNGGTGVASATGTGSVVLSNSPNLVTPALGTPSSGIATNLTGTASGLTSGNSNALSSAVLSTDGTLSADSDLKVATEKAVKTYVDGVVTGLWDDRGIFSAAGGLFPTTGGSGVSGAVVKGDIWTISVAGVLGGTEVNIGDTIRALIDSPGQTSGNWAQGEANLGYTPVTNIRTVNGKALSSDIILDLASVDFANQGTTSTVLHGNASGNPSFAAVSLTSDVSGTLSIVNGGTNSNSVLTNNKVIVSTTGALVESTVTTTELGYLTGVTSPIQTQLGNKVETSTTVNGKALTSNITLALSSSDFSNQGTTSTVLHGNASGNPSFGAVVDADVGAHTSTKITITTKGQLNSAIVYTDQTNTFGAFDQVFPSSRLLVQNPGATFNYIVAGSAIASNQQLTLPLIRQTETVAVVPQKLFSVVGDPAATTNVTGVMMGLAGSITPQVTGSIRITIMGTIRNATNNRGGAYRIYTGTGAAPINGAALTGTAQGTLTTMNLSSNQDRVPFMITADANSFTLGTAIWIDLSLAAAGGAGTVSIFNVTITATEV